MEDEPKQSFDTVSPRRYNISQILIVLIIVALLSGTIGYLIGRNTNINTKNMIMSEPTSTMQPSPIIVSASPITNDIIYVNTKYHYSFVYPKDKKLFSTIEPTPGNPSSVDLSTTCDIYLTANNIIDGHLIFEINTCSFSPTLKADQEALAKFDRQITNMQTITFLNHDALQYTKDNTMNIHFVINGILYSIDYPNNTENKSLLSSFKM